MSGEFPILEAYGITLEEARKVDKIVEELIIKHKDRVKVIKELKRRLKGNKLLYAIGYAEYYAGYKRGQEDLLRQIAKGDTS